MLHRPSYRRTKRPVLKYPVRFGDANIGGRSGLRSFDLLILNVLGVNRHFGAKFDLRFGLAFSVAVLADFPEPGAYFAVPAAHLGVGVAILAAMAALLGAHPLILFFISTTLQIP